MSAVLDHHFGSGTPGQPVATGSYDVAAMSQAPCLSSLFTSSAWTRRMFALKADEPMIQGQVRPAREYARTAC